MWALVEWNNLVLTHKVRSHTEVFQMKSCRIELILLPWQFAYLQMLLVVEFLPEGLFNLPELLPNF